MILSHLIECPIEEATCVVNARGEVREIVDRDSDSLGVRPNSQSDYENWVKFADLLFYGLTPCKPKPVFVEAVSPWRISRIFGPFNYPDFHLVQTENEHGHVVNAGYFKTSDLAGIENIPADQLEIVLRVKKVAP